MFLETSALVEYLLVGPEHARITEALASAQIRFYVSPTVIFDTTTVLASKRRIEIHEAAELLREFLAELDAEIIPVTEETASAAINAFARYGKGRHLAKLNFGDCFSYAGTQAAGVGLLYAGDDFAHADLA